MIKLSLLAICILGAVTSAHAQLGWTLQQCKDKYGIQPTQEDASKPQDYDFRLSQYKVTVTMNVKGVVTDVWFFPVQALEALDLALLDSTEIKSWQGPTMSAHKDGDALYLSHRAGSKDKEYMGLTWKRLKELETAPPLHGYFVWIGYKKGKPVVDLTVHKADKGNIEDAWLETTSVLELSQAIADAKADGEQPYQGP